MRFACVTTLLVLAMCAKEPEQARVAIPEAHPPPAPRDAGEPDASDGSPAVVVEPDPGLRTCLVGAVTPDEIENCATKHLGDWRAAARAKLLRQDGGLAKRDGGPVNGWISPELIQAIVRVKFGRFRVCYEDGLRRDPRLQGRIVTKFVIASDGTVSSAIKADTVGATTLVDDSVVDCVVHGFTTLRFPAPEGGIVTVLYPILFNP